MKLDSLGANHLLSGAAVDQTVIPPSTFASSVQLMIEPPQSSNLSPRLSRYQATRASLFLVLLKNTPPIPVTFAIYNSLGRICPPTVTSSRQTGITMIPTAKAVSKNEWPSNAKFDGRKPTVSQI